MCVDLHLDAGWRMGWNGVRVEAGRAVWRRLQMASSLARRWQWVWAREGIFKRYCEVGVV